MPLFSVWQWVATIGGAIHADDDDIESWRPAFQEIRDAVASEVVKVGGEAGGVREWVPGLHFATCERQFCILAVDPGVSGAVAWYFPGHSNLISAEDMPVVAGEVDAATLARRIEQMRPDLAVVEQVSARPGQGVSSTFKFGAAYGIVRGVLAACGVPCHLVTPSRWKKHFRLYADKEKARAFALRLWPASEHFSRKKDHGRAEAALTARWAAETLIREGAA